MIYLVIFMFIVICFLAGVIWIKDLDQRRLNELLDDLNFVLGSMDRAKEFEKRKKSGPE